MSGNVRRNLAVQLVAGGDNPLRLRIIVNPSIMPIRIGQTIAAGLLALVAQGGTPAYSYSLSSGSLPAGLELDEATGYITGTVESLADSAGTSNAGFHGFVAQVEDSDTAVFEDGFSITVEHVISWVQDSPPPKNEVGIPFSYIFKATGQGANVSYSIAWPFGAPAWATFTSDGRLSGTPSSTALSVPYTVTATDSVSDDSITYDGAISTVAAVTLLPITGVVMPVSSSFSGAVVETGLTTGVGPFVFRVNQRTLPAAVVGGIAADTTDPRIGIISLISAQNPFTGTIDINVIDALGAAASTSIDIATFIPNQQLNAGDGSTAVINPNAITFDPATFDVADDGSGGLHVTGLGGGDSGGGFGNQVITADDEFGNSVENPASLRIYSDDGSVDVLAHPTSDGGLSWRLRANSGDSGGSFGQALFYRLDDITTSSGNDEIFLTNIPYEDTVTTAKIFVQHTTSDGYFLWEEIYPQAGSTYSSSGLLINSSGIYFPISPAFAGEKIRVEYWSTEAASASTAQTSVQNYLDQLGVAPVMAQALRRVISTYSGNLIDVTNSSGSITGSIGMDGSGNLDTAALVTLSAGGDLFVSKWYDQSGNGYHLLGSSAGTEPPIVASGTYIGYLHFGRTSGNLLDIGTPGVTFAATGFAGMYFAGFATNPSVLSINNETNSAWTSGGGGFITVSNGTGTPTYELGFAGGTPNRLLGFALSPYTGCTNWTNLIDTSQASITNALKSFIDGTQQSNTGTLNDDGITGTHFGSFLYNLGARSGNTFPSQMQITAHILYDQDTSAIRSTIESIIT